jgi:hypothetical protein
MEALTALISVAVSGLMACKYVVHEIFEETP